MGEAARRARRAKMTGAELLEELRAGERERRAAIEAARRPATTSQQAREVTCSDCGYHAKGLVLIAAPDKGRGAKRHAHPAVCQAIRDEIDGRKREALLNSARNRADAILAAKAKDPA